MMIRIMLVWAAIIPMAIVNGILRDRYLNRVLAPNLAQTCSGLILSAIVATWTFQAIDWIPCPRLLDYAWIGLFWLALTVVFEFVFGRLVARRSWPELLSPYRFEAGNIWPIVLAVIALSPLLAAAVR
jgi:hypothetical protein